MYVISLITEQGVVEGGKYLIHSKGASGLIWVIDSIGEEYPLFRHEWVVMQNERERIEALQEENAELKFRLDSLEK